jgi:hypothetical protein
MVRSVRQVANVGRGVEHMLAVIKQEEHVAVAQGAGQRQHWLVGVVVEQAAGAANGAQDQVRVGDWRQVDEALQELSDGMAAMRAMALAAGRDPRETKLVVRANVHLTEGALGGDRFVFTGSFEEVAADVRACAEMGATEVFFDMTFTPLGTHMATLLCSMEELRRLVK